ncbi:hypothetical protein AKJ16_DCAP13895 [Drosera capensis]
MNLLRRTQRLQFPLQSLTFNKTHLPISFLVSHSSCRRFSTEAEGVAAGAPIEGNSENSGSGSVIELLKMPRDGLRYGKLFGFQRNTLKSDLITMLEGCTLTPDDVKFVYNRFFTPTSALVRFPSQKVYDIGLREVKNGRVYRLEKADPSEWDFTKFYNGKYVLLQGVPARSSLDDIDRFLQGFDFDASSVEIIIRQSLAGKMAVIRFPSQIEAMNATIRKNRAFIDNFQVNVRVLH